MDATSLVKKIIDAADSGFVSVVFVKKDGSTRQITFNPRDRNDIKGTGKPSQKPNIIRVRDTRIAATNVNEDDPKAWRSFDCDRVVSIRSNGVVHHINTPENITASMS